MIDGKEERSLGFHLARGTGWGIISRWTARILGVVSVLILARLLTPSDFGVVTIAIITAGMIEVFAQTGQWLALVRHPAPTKEHYDSAWTVSVLIGLGLGIAVWLAAPVTVLYFHEPRARAVVHVFALRAMLFGIANVGVVNFQRQLRFRALSAFTAAPSLVGFVAGIASALALRNYWALVIGVMSQELTSFALSYIMEPYRPRFSFAKTGEIWSFSIWTCVRNIGMYFATQIDKVAVGGIAGASTMGRYEAATDLAGSPTAEINNPMIASLAPVMSKVQADPEQRRELYLRVLYWSALICSSTSIGVALVSNDMIDLVLGHQWGDAKPLVPWLAIGFGLLGISNSVYTAFNVIGRPRISAILQWVAVIALLFCVFPAAQYFQSAYAVALARFAAVCTMTPILFVAIAREFRLSLIDYLRALWRPTIASLGMALAVSGINMLFAFGGPLRLCIDVCIGTAAYFGIVMTTWRLIGTPEGPETAVWHILSHAKSRLLLLMITAIRT